MSFTADKLDSGTACRYFKMRLNKMSVTCWKYIGVATAPACCKKTVHLVTKAAEDKIVHPQLVLKRMFEIVTNRIFPNRTNNRIFYSHMQNTIITCTKWKNYSSLQSSTLVHTTSSSLSLSLSSPSTGAWVCKIKGGWRRNGVPLVKLRRELFLCKNTKALIISAVRAQRRLLTTIPATENTSTHAIYWTSRMERRLCHNQQMKNSPWHV